MIETPGHAPSHVCLHQPEQRLLISGDHLLGRVSQYFDIGYTPDPVGEFLHSLDVTEALDARLALAGHARAFTDIPGHIQANRDLSRATSTRSGPRWRDGAKTAYEIARAVYGDQFTEELASWQMTMTTRLADPPGGLGEAARTAKGVPPSTGTQPHKLPAMRIDERIASGAEPAFSFEFFPPKTDDGEANLADALTELARLEPTFVSVTYGAGGTPAERGKTIDIVARIKADHGLEAMAHFTCVGATVDELRAVLDRMRDAGIENVLALRGDPPPGVDASEWTAAEGGLRYSRELIELIRADYDFAVGAACFPEVHLAADPPRPTCKYTREKVDAGAKFLITQLFFDNQLYYDFVARARDAGIEVPIIPGIMPITNAAQIRRFTQMCGASIPPGLLRELELRADQPEAVADFGVAYATMQCADLLANGAPGIHFYTLNRSPSTRAILSALRCLAPWRRAVTGVARRPRGRLAVGGLDQLHHVGAARAA